MTTEANTAMIIKNRIYSMKLNSMLIETVVLIKEVIVKLEKLDNRIETLEEKINDCKNNCRM